MENMTEYLNGLVEYLKYPVFGIYLLLIVAGGLTAVLSKNLVRALVGLILTLFGVAGIYFLMSAPFIALMQILIYVGAVTVLIFFAIMLTRVPDGEAGMESGGKKVNSQTIMALLSGLAPVFLLGVIIFQKMPDALPLKPETSITVLGGLLVGPYSLAFELISVVLFAAMAGAVLLGFERRDKK
jgi:NADH:ubiquinone oxidoreductase subunit 6 (subunit J)